EMSKVASDYLKLTPKILKNPSITDINKELSQDIPVIIPANGKLLFKENRHFSNGGPYYHNLVILGFDDHRQQFIVHDVGTQFGAYFHYSYDLLIDSIHDLPANGDKTQISDGSKQALILLK
ncbi:MAG TPA: C39 family peptidase, partial [Patescibacteria group bacterium]